MHPEKGFTLKESNYIDFMAHIRQIVEALNWELFCEKRPSVDEEIKAPITSSAINEFFELPDFGDDKYSSLMGNIEFENLQEILEELIVPCSKWTVSKQGIHTCRREYLTPLAKQQVEKSEDHEEKEEEDPTEIKPRQLVVIPDKVEPIELVTELDIATSIFRTQSPRSEL
ncbi:hypothetical protein PVK06_039836 [Gossypium arboreum]|uniref:Uncharacterized protein n=1 Tax=Gossypium arboreum TaxID=29729 RepID=A0ABR0N3Y6_GOSAR|nr:hypothetical protein PVK06_039836 [Gossypium arboreum]